MSIDLIADKNITFEEAIALTHKFIEQINQLSEKEKSVIISSLVASENGARGFFVTYLTSDNPIADHPSEGIISGLKTSPEIVSELLVKNVAMSTAMRITHTRNNDPEMAESSLQVTQRSLNLINQLSLREIQAKIEQLKNTIVETKGTYQDFLNKWGYDLEQKEIILNTLNNLA